LPRDLRIHPVHHVSLLDSVAEDPLPGQIVTPPPPVEVDGDQEYQVERVEDSRVYRNQLQYLIRWTGYDQMTWEPARDVNRFQALDVFHKKYPQKPRPLERFSEDLDARGGILLRPQEITYVIGYIRKGTRGDVQEPGENWSLSKEK
jgi:predicted GH43/DUF377 family glycosyl hydrolase